jgi:hypothetical protein
MAKTQIIKQNKFDAGKVRFSGKMVNKSRGTPTFYVNYEYPDGTVAPLRIQTQKMKSPFGISGTGKSVGENTLFSKDTLSLSLDQEHQRLIDNLEKLDSKAFSVGFECVREFLTKIDDSDSPEVVESTARKSYSKTVRYAFDKQTKKRKDFPPTFSGNLYKTSAGVYNSASFYDAIQAEQDISNGQQPKELDMTIDNYSELFPPMSDVGVVMKCSSLWTSTLGFGLLWVPEKVRIWKSANKIEGFGFDDSEEDAEDVVEDVAEEDVGVDDLEKLEVTEDPSDDEVDELDTIVSPPPAVKASSRRKKVAA